jgi:hypothetical protein
MAEEDAVLMRAHGHDALAAVAQQLGREFDACQRRQERLARAARMNEQADRTATPEAPPGAATVSPRDEIWPAETDPALEAGAVQVRGGTVRRAELSGIVRLALVGGNGPQ